jgi:beta-glucosidase
MNIKRSPLCGRNFEYYSEDPLVSTEMAGALVHGVQSKHIGTSPKHFMANNQEYHRLTSSSEMDERTMREIYLASFEGMVKKEKPWTIMNAYNKLNGTYLCENKEMLTDVLRREWGFDGYVMTDWGAMNDRVEALKAGCNLEMPSCEGATDVEIVAAVQDGTLDESVLDKSCEEYLNVIFKYEENRDKNAVFQHEKDHETAREIEEECIVLLKNEDALLPLSADKKVAFIGKYAEEPRYQGGGSSHINSFKTESAKITATSAFAAASTAFAANASSALSSTSSKPLANVMFSFFTVARNSTASIADSVLKLLMWELPPP